MRRNFVLFICLYLVSACEAFGTTYDLADYGALPNDELNDSEILQKLLNDIDSVKGQKSIVFNSGTYIFNNPINLSSNIRLVGKETTIISNNQILNFTFFIGSYSASLENVQLKNLNISVIKLQNKYIGISLPSAVNMRNKNIEIINCRF